MFTSKKMLESILGSTFYSRFVIIVFFQIISILMEVFSISLIIPILDLLFGESQNQYTLYLQENLINFNLKNILFFTLLIFFFKFFFLIYISFKRNQLMRDINNYLSSKITSYYLNLKFLSYQKNSSSKFIRDANDVRFAVDYVRGCENLITGFCVTGGFFIFSLIFNFKLTLVIFIYFLIFGFIYYITFNSKVKYWGKKRRELEKDRFKVLSNIFTSLVNIKLFTKEKFFLKKFMNKNNEFETNILKQKIVQDIPKNYFELLSIILIMISILFVSSQDKSQNLENIILNLAIMIAILYKVTPSIMKIILNKQLMNFSHEATIKFLESTRLSKIKLRSENNSSLILNLKKKIELKDVSFRYSSKNVEVLKKINLKINTGEMIGIKGESGQGKSTLVNIITGLMKPYKGKILSDNKNIYSNVKEWQKNICYVPQNLNLLGESIRENIAFGSERKNIDNTKIKKILIRLNLKKFINKLSDKINEENLNFSGGQIQRIGIARLLYHNRSLLILDEATNSLDLNNERKVLADLKKIKKDKIIIVISHRKMSHRNFDKIFEIKEGKLNRID